MNVKNYNAMLSLSQKAGLRLNDMVIHSLEEVHPLQQLFWECTLRCNLKCRHCGSDCVASSVQKDMPWEDFHKVLVNVKEHYDSHKILIILSGGEPMMRPDIFKIGRAIYDMEFPWGMVSNGMLINPKTFDGLLKSGLRSATISLDGLHDLHDSFRGVQGSFDNAIRAISLFTSAGNDIAFDVVTCVGPHNIDQLPQIKELLISLGVKAWRLFAIFPAGRAANDKSLQLSSDQFRSLMEFIVANRKEGRIITRYSCEGFLGEYEKKVRDYYYYCAAGLTVASVRVNGDISGCTSIRSNYSQGNIYKDDFIDVWENRFQPFRDRSWMKTGKCAECKFFRHCKGSGMHLRDENGELMRCTMDWLQ